MNLITSKIKSRNIVNSISLIDKSNWDKVSKDQNIYLSYSYLIALEGANKDEMDFYYSISYNDRGNPILISAFQLVTFSDRAIHKSILSKQFCALKSKLFSHNLLICGNIFSDGENGFIYNDSLTPSEAVDEMSVICEEIKQSSKKTKKKVSFILFKEFWEKNNTYSPLFSKNRFKEFMVDVNMVLPIHESWKSKDDYLFSLKTKYRTRAKSVFKKSKNILIKDLSSLEINSNLTIIGELHANVIEKSNFSLGQINPLTFVKLKENLGDQFILRGAFLNDKMVGFSTSFIHNNILEANYVGIDYELNFDLAIYQRLLYDYTELAIQLKAKELQLGRTSELIKSALGALPENMKLYVKHRSTLPNLLLKPILHFVSPSKFELRKPFKAEYSN
ncbi:MAG: hypothetical protein ACPGVD_11275 [Flavobacteriales bacterium]